MAYIKVKLNKDRNAIGKLELYNGHGLPVLSVPAFGRADIGKAKQMGNPTASTLLPFGHTPTGKYHTNNQIIPSGDGTRYNANSYGPNGILFLQPAAGNALTAKGNGRTGLAIHGGKIGAGNKLRPTNGCVRLANNDMAALINQVRFLYTQSDNIQYIEVFEENQLPLVYGDLVTASSDPDPFVIA